MTENLVKQQSVFIRKNYDPSFKRMGMEKYPDIVLMDGTAQGEQLSCIDRNGVLRFVTGLDEFAPEVQNIADPEKKKSKIKQIREKVAWLEQMLNHKNIDPKDPDFWSKIERVHPGNKEFWQTVELVLDNVDKKLDVTSPMDFIIMSCIEAGGFPMVAKSYDDAKSSPSFRKFFLDKGVDTSLVKTEVMKIRNRALGTLQELFEEGSKKLLYIAKTLGGNSTLYKNNTAIDVLYIDLDLYINGKGIESSEKKAAKNFIEATELTNEDLRAKAIIMDASVHNIIVTKSDGMIHHNKSGSLMGHNIQECIEFLKNPVHHVISDAVNKEVESVWNRP